MGIIYRYRCGIGWRDVPAVFGPWQAIWTWHRRLAREGIRDTVLRRLLTTTEAAERIDRAIAVDSTIARAHQHATRVRGAKAYSRAIRTHLRARRITAPEADDHPRRPR